MSDDVTSSLLSVESLVQNVAFEPPLAFSGSSPDPESHHEDQAPIASTNIPLWRRVLEYYRPFYILDHLTYKDSKVVLRSWVQVFVGVVLATVPRTSRWIGNATYLMQIMSFIAVSGGKLVQASFNENFVVVLFAVISWLFEVVSLKICNRLRGGITHHQVTQALIDEGSCTVENIASCFESQVYTARYLETRTSVIFIFALIIGIALFGYLDSLKYPRSGFIAGLISLIITLCYTVFYPTFQPMVGLSVIKPLGVGAAIAFAVSVVIFPHTSSYQYLDSTLSILKSLKVESTNNLRFFHSIKPSEGSFSNYKEFKKNVHACKGKIHALDVHVPMIEREFSYSRFNQLHLKSFRALLRSLLHVSSGYDSLYEMIQEKKDWADDNLTRRVSVVSQNGSIASHGDSKFFTTIHESYKQVGEYENNRRVTLLKKKILNLGYQKLTIQELDFVTSIIQTNCSSLIEVTDRGLQGIVSWLENANDFRIFALWPGKWNMHKQRQQESHESLEKVKQNIIEEMETFSSIPKLEELTRQASLNEETLLCLISELSLYLHLCKNHCRHLLRIIDLFLVMDKEQPYPKFLSYFTKGTSSFEDDVPKFEDEDTSFLDSQVQARDPDANAPSNVLNLVGIQVVKVYHFLLHPQLWFLIRAGGVVALAATPYFVRTTAQWYFNNRLVWVVIMTALSTFQTTGQSVYVFGSKLVYSFYGSLLGLVGWYISRGNYYGYPVVCGVIYLYLVYYRHFAKHNLVVPNVLFAVTTILVLGTSFVDLKYSQVANIGSGWRVAYTRFVSVIVGLCIGFLACLFPKPHSSRTDLRRLLAKIISESGTIHCYVSKFALHRVEYPNYHIKTSDDLIVNTTRKNFRRVAKISSLMVALTHEIPISGSWPEAKYAKLHNILYDITLIYFLLLSIFDQVEDPEEWVPIMLRKMGWSSASLNGDLFGMIHMSSDALLTRNQLPKITDSNLSVKHLEILTNRWGIAKGKLRDGFYRAAANSSLEHQSREGDVHESVMENLDFQKIYSHDGQLSNVSLILAHMLFERLDQVMIVVKSLVGEKYDFDISGLEDPEEDSKLLPLK
ncbi:uncharacterized protein CANTADRAFT_91602 [Suhomyces tanzawaensis NRRL Y-17324]|uniref:ER transporter 6TM N-terminal domain-containing protein n=1 Tax=Suhomyces tanzawaensis NRRL Y-17324 TaxID=984487 RepID=A0A1E4SFD4_9ASCO|nr:uncharacterized protein CANTADRAFT_91602 [Suhomyces tanzawaensis NRRL Y-17324]ODV78175.1 hypothetical protein CANTADRAFT_91602 [Suhomyces tanzawaensis NRRL Y-17324]